MTHTKPPNEKEKSLWDWFTRDISQINKNVHQDDSENIIENTETVRPVHKPVPQKAPQSQPLAIPKVQIFVEQLDKRTLQKIKRGSIPIAYKLDLHGCTKDEAYALLNRTLFQNYERGVRTHLVVTGKGKSSGSEGILKKNVPIWLKSMPFSEVVHKIGTASITHGGEGALYVFLRKKKP